MLQLRCRLFPLPPSCCTAKFPVPGLQRLNTVFPDVPGSLIHLPVNSGNGTEEIHFKPSGRRTSQSDELFMFSFATTLFPFRIHRERLLPAETRRRQHKGRLPLTGRRPLLKKYRPANNLPRSFITAFSAAVREPGQEPWREQQRPDACRKPQNRHTWPAASCPGTSVHANGTGRPLP